MFAQAYRHTTDLLLPGLLRKHLFIYSFIYCSPNTQFPRAEILKYGTEIMPGMVTMRARKLRTYQLGMPR